MNGIILRSTVILICSFLLTIALGGGDYMNIETIITLKDILVILLITAGILMIAFLIED